MKKFGFIRYKIIRIKNSMRKQSDMTKNEKLKFLHRIFIHNLFVSARHEAFHTHQVNVLVA